MKRPISALLFCLFAVSAFGDTVYVDANGTGDYPTIQAAIDDANDGDVIILQPGTYTDDGNRDIDFLGKPITVKSENGPENCIIDCQGTYSENHRGFYFTDNEGQNSILEGLTITNAYVVVACEAGAGIYIDGASPTIDRCIVTNNHAELESGSLCFCKGGGIFISDANNLLITNSTVSDNFAGAWGLGGGIYCSGGPEDKVTLQNCLIANNTALAEYGGGGGGINCNYLANLTISNCTITGNVAISEGGGIFCDSIADVTIQNCIISNNNTLEEFGYGGGIYCAYPDDLAVINCTITNNSVIDEGGGIYFYAHEGSSTGTFINNIIWGNSPDQIYIYDAGIVLYSDIQGGWPALGNIDIDPCFADADANDYHLKSQAGRWDPNSQTWVADAVTSPCIDAGNPGCPPDAEPLPNGNRINMGFYGGTSKASKSPANFRSLSDLDNDWNVDFNDLAIFVSYWLDSGTCLPSDLDRNSSVDFEDYAIFTYDPCSGSAAGEPEIIYQVEDCAPGALMMSVLNGDGNDLRFSVTVDGQYILFEDMMLANCCPEELVLQMTVEGDLITIQEIEYLGEFACTCLCDHPVTATLGPFSSGTYILEVYQDEFYGGFIGSTIVTID
jgi:hypothetical protein